MINQSDLLQLRRAASDMALHNKAPIYLVGSATNPERMSLDIDVVMVVSKEKFKLMFGVTHDDIDMDWRDQKLTPAFEKYSRFHWKAAEYFQQFLIVDPKRVDFKLQTEERFSTHREETAIRLDMFESLF